MNNVHFYKVESVIISLLFIRDSNNLKQEKQEIKSMKVNTSTYRKNSQEPVLVKFNYMHIIKGNVKQAGRLKTGKL